MEYICNFFKNKDISFFIATDETQDLSLFQNYKFTLRVGYPLENMYTLSKCDFLIGPPSSFIGWSQIYGSKPLFSIIEPLIDSKSINSFLNNLKIN